MRRKIKSLLLMPWLGNKRNLGIIFIFTLLNLTIIASDRKTSGVHIVEKMFLHFMAAY